MQDQASREEWAGVPLTLVTVLHWPEVQSGQSKLVMVKSVAFRCSHSVAVGGISSRLRRHDDGGGLDEREGGQGEEDDGELHTDQDQVSDPPLGPSNIPNTRVTVSRFSHALSSLNPINPLYVTL